MMHTTGRSVLRHGPWALGTLGLSFIAIAAAGGPAEAQPRAFVANTNANTVTVVDTAADNPDARTSFGVGAAPGPIVIAKDGRAFVGNTGANSISVITIDPDLGSSVATIATNEHPVSLALSPDGDTVYMMDAAGNLEICSTSALNCATRLIGGSSTARLAVTASGDRVYIASDIIYELNTATGQLSSFVADANPTVEHANYPVDIAILPDGRLYIAVVTYYYTWRGFSAGGGIVVVDPSGDTPVVTQTIDLFSLPGALALSADGTRAFVGIQWYWADTLYGAAFMPASWVATIDTGSNTTIAWTDLGAESTAFAGTHVPAGLAVAPDRSAVFVSVPNIDSLLEISTDTNLVTRRFQFDGAGPSGVAVPPNPEAKPKAFVIEAVDDGPSVPRSEGSAGIALANVLANDKVGGGPATSANVTLSTVSSSSPSLTLDPATGAVWVGADAGPGSYNLTYQICDVDNADNCGQAVARVSVRARFALHAVEDTATSYAGAQAIASVLANDLVDADPASFDTVALSMTSSDAGITLAADGSVSIAAGVAPGSRSLGYQICDLTSEGNCSAGAVTVTVIRRPIAAGADSGSAPRTGGLAVANVLANDTLEDTAATLARVTLTSLSSSDPGVTLTAAGSVVVAQGAAPGLQTLQYRICEAASADNCSDGTVSVTVRQNQIVAVGESVRANNKDASTPVRNVLANDSLGGAPATLGNVKLTQVSVSPSNTRIRLNADGSVSVGDKAGSGTYALLYQICESASPANCAQATVSINLSGKN